jgi:succinate dehydrogenase / fumarate reductase iron-sulfur subunit
MADGNNKPLAPGDPVVLRIRRQAGPDSPPYWEEFEVQYAAGMNVLSALMAVAAKPVTRTGQATSPVAYDASCLEEVCGSCTMVINGFVRQACSTLVDGLPQPIVLEPMSKFPTLRDLVVDRSEMFLMLQRIKAFVPIDGTFALGAGPRISEKVRQRGYEFSRCMTCGCCLEACPQYNRRSHFIGAASIGQVFLFNSHPTGAELKEDRLEVLAGPGGIAECGNAQNCQKVCPKDIPLLDAIAQLGRQTTAYALRRFLER